MKSLIAIIILSLSFTQVTNITQGETYTSISEAVEQVNDYDIIEVSSQTYYERVIIWNPLTLIGLEGATINVSDQWSSGIIVAASDVTILGFEIIGNENTVAGIEVTPGCDNITISDNIIHGMSMPNPANMSNFSYGILAYGSESTPNPPVDLVISGNEIFEISGSGISLGSFTINVTINDNFIHDITPIEYGDDYISVGIMGSYSDQVAVINNDLTNLTAAINFSISNGIIEGNSYNSTPILFTSTFFITEEDDGFEFITSNNYYMATSAVSAPLIYMHIYCNSLSMAMLLADDGSVILTSEGEEIIQDCDGEWGGENFPVCDEDCGYILGDVNDDGLIDVLDILTIISYIYGDVELGETSLCLGDLDQNGEINILDIVGIVNQIVS